MKTKLITLLGISSLTLAFIYAQFTHLTLTIELVALMILLSGLTISLAALAAMTKENN